MASERDLQLLETFLDGELSPADGQRVQARLASEPELAEEVRNLQAQRLAREAYFAALEPERGEIDRVVMKIEGAIERRRRRIVRFAWARYASALAACLVVGIFVGWMLNMRGGDAAPQSSAATARPVYHVSIRDESGNVLAVQEFESLEQARDFSRDIAESQERDERLFQGMPTIRSMAF